MSTAPPEPAAQPVSSTCVSCGAPRTGEFCSCCGQRAPRGRLSLRGIAIRFAAELGDLDRGFAHTTVALFRRPGGIVRDYIAGRTVRYVSPAKYLTLWVALTTLAYLQLGLLTEMADGFTGGLAADGEQAAPLGADEVHAWMASYMNVVLLAGVPFMTLASRLVFRRAGFNLAEHLVFNVYVYAQQCLFLLILLLAFHPFGGAGSFFSVLYLLAAFGYYTWASVDFFRLGKLGDALRAVLVSAVGTLAYGVVMMAALVVALLARA